MFEFIAEYGLFLAKTLTILLTLIILFTMIFALSSKNKKEDGVLVIENLNEKMSTIYHTIQSETMARPLWKKWLKNQKQQDKVKNKEQKTAEASPPRLFVIEFEGDIRASQVSDLREVISAIIQSATPSRDEVLVKIESAGGFVHGYGLAASQLQRLRDKQIHLTVAVDKMAASGGYMMACVANKIIAAPFAIVGSIGVVAQLPNFHRLLEKNHIDYEMLTAGEYKRTLTLFGKNTPQGKQKFQQEIDETHVLFKEFITTHRPQMNMNEVATGEHWHAMDAIKYQLIDEIQTSDDFVLNKINAMQAFALSYHHKQKLAEKITGSFTSLIEKWVAKWGRESAFSR